MRQFVRGITLRDEILLLELTPKKEEKEEAILLDKFIKMIVPERRVTILPIDSKKLLLDAIRKTDSSFVHISCHGNEDKEGPYIQTLKKGKIRPLDFAKDSLKRRFVMISGCYIGKAKFAKPFIEHTKAAVLIAPQKDIPFPDAALYWVNFYYRLFSKRPFFKKDREAIMRIARAAYPKSIKGALGIWW